MRASDLAPRRQRPAVEVAPRLEQPQHLVEPPGQRLGPRPRTSRRMLVELPRPLGPAGRAPGRAGRGPGSRATGWAAHRRAASAPTGGSCRGARGRRLAAAAARRPAPGAARRPPRLERPVVGLVRLGQLDAGQPHRRVASSSSVERHRRRRRPRCRGAGRPRPCGRRPTARPARRPPTSTTSPGASRDSGELDLARCGRGAARRLAPRPASSRWYSPDVAPVAGGLGREAGRCVSCWRSMRASTRTDRPVGLELGEGQVEQVVGLGRLVAAAPGWRPCCRSAGRPSAGRRCGSTPASATWSNATNGDHSTTA